MWIFTVPMWPTVCVSVPAELSPRTLCHLQPGRESGSPHRSTHGWAPFANTVPTHPVTCRHVHMPALLIEMQNVVCVVLLCVMFHNPLFAIPYVLSKKLTRTLSPPSPPLWTQSSSISLVLHANPGSFLKKTNKNCSSSAGCDYATFSAEITHQQGSETGNFPRD